ncbi:hypothetical protein LTR10_018166 [Elasticomyces elasticus]|uniref:Terpene synthase n=1 Tax=Exophiala sideris TaxID=1016849 RepID=A0ABR0J307_9EURO|nr:hypothetical protein LTR10_018166 [Elasticomyces elasticus]KAK5024954.1 hypothetical protein LTS07_008332 [Exophiala sideris]KAK5031457.1 hypothetical protein LTR13_007785 [Exophiala sideris]KAK5054992.1 hypothetical protein LTR69_008560 [Exophiala sideris]KAK5179873.1 hypothetical protein LTR44_007689 [Eurotiomycetes sp. CCFEE 6388]
MPRFSRLAAHLRSISSTTSFTSLSEASVYHEEEKEATIVECTEIILECDEELLVPEKPLPEPPHYYARLSGQRFSFKSSPEMGVQLVVPDSDQWQKPSAMGVAQLESSLCFKSFLAYRTLAEPGPLEQRVTFRQRCLNEFETIRAGFPGIVREDIRLCMAAWVALDRALRDMLSRLSPKETAETVQVVANMLHDFSEQTSPGAEEHLELRGRALGMLPLLHLAAQDGVTTTWELSPNLQVLRELVSLAVVLQNDLVNLEEDLAASRTTNYVIMVAGDYAKSLGLLPMSLQIPCLHNAIQATIERHNELVRAALQRHKAIVAAVECCEEWEVADVVIAYLARHFSWASSAKGYRPCDTIYEDDDEFSLSEQGISDILQEIVGDMGGSDSNSLASADTLASVPSLASASSYYSFE